MLLVHEAKGFCEQGMSVSLSDNPTPSAPLGFTAPVAPSWGGQTTSGGKALWGRETVTGMAAYGGRASAGCLDANLGYGLPVGDRCVRTPQIGFGTSESREPEASHLQQFTDGPREAAMDRCGA